MHMFRRRTVPLWLLPLAACSAGTVFIDDPPQETASTATTAPDTGETDTDPPPDTEETDTEETDTEETATVDTEDTDTLEDTGPVDTVPGFDASAFLFDDGVIRDFQIDLPPASFNALIADPYTYVEGTLTFEGETWAQVGVRTKGQNSWQPITQKASLKLKIDWMLDQEFFGMTEVTLNAMNDDSSMMHERVAYRLYREAGVPAARAMHATVTLNGEPNGLYTHLDTVDRTFIQRWYDHDEGPLFEQWDVDFYDQYIACPGPGYACFELEYGKDDRTALQGVADALETGPYAERIANASEYIDYEQFLLYWAVGSVVGQFDAYPYSWPGDDCHVYFDPGSGRLNYIPHGMDETFSSSSNNVVNAAGGVLALTCRNDPTCAAQIKEMIWQAQDLSETIDTLAYHDMVADQIEDYVRADTTTSHSNSTVFNTQASMRSFIANRRLDLTSQIGPP
jgi:spore coat protein CotH